LGLLEPDPKKRKTAVEAKTHVWLTGKTATTSDLLPNVSAGFNARKRFRKAIEMVRLANRLKAMEVSDNEEEAEVPTITTTDEETRTNAPNEELSQSVSQMNLNVGDDRLLAPKSGNSSSRKNSFSGRKFRSGSEVFAEVVKAKVREAQVEAEPVEPAQPDK
jgi:calcium/calmodulin-dependent protein kinase I